MLSTIMAYFFFACVLFFLIVLFYVSFIKKPNKLEKGEKKCYNDDVKEKDKVSPNQSQIVIIARYS